MSEILKKEKVFPWRPVLFGLLLVAVVVMLWILSGRNKSPDGIRNVLLISLDTCRADHLSCYGYPHKTTPNIDKIAEEAVLFEHVVSPVPLTMPAHSSMLTSTIPPYHGVRDNSYYQLGKSNLTIAEILQQNGFTTGAIISSFVLDAQFGLNQGFDTYNDHFVDPIPGYNHNERRGDETSRFACAWLKKYQKEPFFLFLHYYDPHDEYHPPQPFADTFKDNLYAGEIAYTDDCISQVIKTLKKLGLYDSTLIIITSDHGEGRGEHSESLHGYFIYQSCVQVPLIIKMPGGPEGKRVRDLVGLVDIVPTICGALGITPPQIIHGTDLTKFFEKKDQIKKDERYVYCESLLPMQYDCTSLLGLVSDSWKYIHAPRPELYNLDNDPYETKNLAVKESKRANLLQSHLKLILQDQMRADRTDSDFILDEESRKRLESLGYIAAGNTSEDFEFDSTKGDPKDALYLHQQTRLVQNYMKLRRYSEAEVLCKQLIAKRPQYIIAHFMLGEIAREQNKVSESIEYYSDFLSQAEQAGKQQSGEQLHHFVVQRICETHNYLGMAFLQQGRLDHAIMHYSKALQIRPRHAIILRYKILYNLGNVYIKQSKFDEAIVQYNKALELNSDFAECHYNLSLALFELGKLEAAVVHCKEALRVKPDWGAARYHLMDMAKKTKSGMQVK